MLIARRLSDGAISPDFQTHATADVLIANAVRSGFVADETELEVIEVTRAEFEQLIEDMYGAQREAEREARRTVRNTVVAQLNGIVGTRIQDLNNAQRNALLAAVLFKLGVINNNGRIAPLADWLDE